MVVIVFNSKSDIKSIKMKHATLIYPHQLFLKSPALDKEYIVYLIEEPLMLREFPIHAQKLILHRLSINHYKKELESNGYTVRHIKVESIKKTEDVTNHHSFYCPKKTLVIAILNRNDIWRVFIKRCE